MHRRRLAPARLHLPYSPERRIAVLLRALRR